MQIVAEPLDAGTNFAELKSRSLNAVAASCDEAFVSAMKDDFLGITITFNFDSSISVEEEGRNLLSNRILWSYFAKDVSFAMFESVYVVRVLN